MTLAAASAAGLVGAKRVLDSTPLYDAVATMDTVTLIRSGALRGLLRVADAALEVALRAVLVSGDDYASTAKPQIDWDDAQARQQLIDFRARDAHACLALLAVEAAAPAGDRVVGRDGVDRRAPDWLRRQRFDQPALAVAYDSALETVLLTADRRDRLDKTIVELAADPAWAPVVTRLQCLRGVSTLTAFGLAVEVGDWTRFTGSTIGAFLGLVPTEHSSGGSRSQGSITKTGNTHARRLLVEAAWHHRKPYRTPSKVDAVPLGAGPGRRPGPWARRQPAAASTLADVPGPQEAAGDRERRRRSGTRRLVLVPRHPRRHRRGLLRPGNRPPEPGPAGGPATAAHAKVRMLEQVRGLGGDLERIPPRPGGRDRIAHPPPGVYYKRIPATARVGWRRCRSRRCGCGRSRRGWRGCGGGFGGRWPGRWRRGGGRR